MDIFKSTSRHKENFESKIHAVTKGKKRALMVSFLALSCLAFSPAWAGGYHHVPAAPIHLTSLSIVIGPGGFHLGIGAPFYGRGYARPHVHVVPVPVPYWNQSRHHQHYVAPQRFNRGHGWKNNGPRGNFRGNGRHRGGRR